MVNRCTTFLIAGACLLVSVIACSGGSSSEPRDIPNVPAEKNPGTKVAVGVDVEGLAELTQAVTEARAASAEEVRQAHPVTFDAALDYDPMTAQNLDLLLDRLDESSVNELREGLATNGFVIAADGAFPSFAYGYSVLYEQDLPVFISADMVLEALFRSHDKILQAIELESLRPRLARLLSQAEANLVDRVGRLTPRTASDLHLYLGVARALLNDGIVPAGAAPGVESIVDSAMNAAGEQSLILFDVERRVDFSQFKPRGHYHGDSELEGYFRAMIWLGRIDLRLLETQGDGSQVLRRQQIEDMLALRELIDDAAYDDYSAIDHTISLFVGEHDYMTLQDADRLEEALGNPESIDDIDDATLIETLIGGQYDKQRIASHIMRKDPSADTLPLNVSFALFGQRYTVDSHVFSNVVYDRVPLRVVPNPLDVAFSALGNNQALDLLGNELDEQPEYPGALEAMRLLVDEHPSEYWQSSLYTSWLSALRSLSPKEGPQPSDLPSVARTDAWGRRLLNTQLSSWAQLRHNNVLYVKQSYTSAASCEYPDAYVDPYPEFFWRVVQLAEAGQQLVNELDLSSDLGKQLVDYFGKVSKINTMLAEMAELQRTGQPHSKEHLAFINQAVTVSVNCDGTILGHSGWYSDLHFDPLEAVEAEPVITDVHTDIGGDLPVSRPATVLHVGTGLPRLMLMTVDSCSGPRAYAGIVSAYHELLVDGLTRLTDEEWEQRQYAERPVDVAWLAPVLAAQ